MAKKIKLNIKNTQIAEALNLKKIKLSSAGKKPTKKKKEETPKKRKVRVLPKKIEKVEKPEISPEKKAVKVPKTKEKEKSKPLKKEKSEKKPSLEKPLEKKEEPSLEKEEKVKLKQKKEIPPEKKKKPKIIRAFDVRDKKGLREEDEEVWRKKRKHKKIIKIEKKEILRPKSLKIKIPISIKDLASQMKLKASELISKLFSQGIVITLNDYLDDEDIIQLLGHEFSCEISIDKSVEERIQITEKSVKEEIASYNKDKLKPRPPIIAFMGHVDHGKTSIVDRIRKSNVVEQEAGAITQHIGAFIAKTSLGYITIIDTPGHEAFTAMRLRGAFVTDIIVLVIAGDEGIKEQTIEAINQAKKAKVPIIVAINKSDKKGYDPEKIYRELSDHDLLPEAWGGTTITVNCSALKNIGIDTLLEMISLQAEILELKAAPSSRARGVILESEMHKGFGAVATMLVQNGTLKISDSFVFGGNFGKVKTMHDQNQVSLKEAPPSYAVRITGLNSLAEAGCEFIVVENEKTAKSIAHERAIIYKKKKIAQFKKTGMDRFSQKKIKELPIILKADMQGSLEALKNGIEKIKSEKVKLNIIKTEIGEISESDINLSNASNAPIIGFHTKIESHAEQLIKELNVRVIMHDIIYHVTDAVKELMKEQLDKIEEEKISGEAVIKAVFTSSQIGKIAGCMVTNGVIKRSQNVKIFRNDEEIYKGKIATLKKVQEDVKEVPKGMECGIVFENFSDIQEKDVIQSYDIKYISQSL